MCGEQQWAVKQAGVPSWGQQGNGKGGAAVSHLHFRTVPWTGRWRKGRAGGREGDSGPGPSAYMWFGESLPGPWKGLPVTEAIILDGPCTGGEGTGREG